MICAEARAFVDDVEILKTIKEQVAELGLNTVTEQEEIILHQCVTIGCRERVSRRK